MTSLSPFQLQMFYTSVYETVTIHSLHIEKNKSWACDTATRYVHRPFSCMKYPFPNVEVLSLHVSLKPLMVNCEAEVLIGFLIFTEVA